MGKLSRERSAPGLQYTPFDLCEVFLVACVMLLPRCKWRTWGFVKFHSCFASHDPIPPDDTGPYGFWTILYKCRNFQVLEKFRESLVVIGRLDNLHCCLTSPFFLSSLHLLFSPFLESISRFPRGLTLTVLGKGVSISMMCPPYCRKLIAFGISHSPMM